MKLPKLTSVPCRLFYNTDGENKGGDSFLTQDIKEQAVHLIIEKDNLDSSNKYMMMKEFIAIDLRTYYLEIKFATILDVNNKYGINDNLRKANKRDYNLYDLSSLLQSINDNYGSNIESQLHIMKCIDSVFD